MRGNKLYLVVPCYNEEEVLPETSRRLVEKLNSLIEREKVDAQSRILFVDDGSKDRTWELIAGYHRENRQISGLKLSRNKGHQNALLAGLTHAKELCDMAISLDADLQDDVDVIDQFVDQYLEGCDIVYGVRSARDTDTAFKRTTAVGFYKVMKALGVDIVENHADYRLMSRRALEALSQFSETNLFLRGIVPLIGFKTGVVTYERHERQAGTSKYPLKKMLAFAFDGITSFSVKPIRMITSLGVIMAAVSFVCMVVFWIMRLCGSYAVGWGNVVAPIWLVGGINMIALGLVGEYIGKIYSEVKRRPLYIVDTVLDE